MGLLDGGLQQMFGAAFAPHLLDGRHYRRQETRDTKGNVTSVVTKVQGFKGYREADDKRRTEAGYRPNEATLLMLQTYEGRVIDRPMPKERVKLDGVMWVLGDMVEEDAAHVAWRFRATPE